MRLDSPSLPKAISKQSPRSHTRCFPTVGACSGTYCLNILGQVGSLTDGREGIGPMRICGLSRSVEKVLEHRSELAPCAMLGTNRTTNAFEAAAADPMVRVQDIHRCWDAVRHAPAHRIHTFLATSDIHLEYKLKISREVTDKPACSQLSTEWRIPVGMR